MNYIKDLFCIIEQYSILNSNKYLSLEVIDKICAALECQPEDLLEYVRDEDNG